MLAEIFQMKIIRVLKDRFRHEPFYIEWVSGLSILGWAIVSWSAGARLADQASYALIVRILTDDQWEGLLAALGVMQLCSVAVDIKWLRWTSAFLMSWLWFFLASAIWEATPGAPGGWLYATQGVANLLTVALLMGNSVRFWPCR